VFVIHPETRTVYRAVNLNQSMNAKFEVVTAALAKIQLFWDTTPCTQQAAPKCR